VGHVRKESFRYIEAYYNRARIQKELGYLSPAEYESGFDIRMAEAA
jgi:putative transposase